MNVALKSVFEEPLDRPGLGMGLYLGQNWSVAENPIWSRDVEASIIVLAEAFPRPVPLVLTFSLFNATQEAPKTLKVESPGHEPVEIQVTTSGLCSVQLKTPVHPRGAKSSPISFRLNSIDSAVKMGLSTDDRMLGLQIHALTPEVPLSFPLDFTRIETCAAVLGEGWAPPEPETGVWSLSEKAVLTLSGNLLPSGGGELIFHGAALPRPPGMEPLIIEVESDGRTLVTWRISHEKNAGPWHCPLPPGPQGARHDFTLSIRGAVSPASLGINVDKRLLGLLLKELAILRPESRHLAARARRWYRRSMPRGHH